MQSETQFPEDPEIAENLRLAYHAKVHTSLPDSLSRLIGRLSRQINQHDPRDHGERRSAS